MKSNSLASFRHVLAAVSLLCVPAASAAPAPELKGAFKDIPLQVQEFHLWWATPYQGEPGERGWSKWLWGGEVEIDRAVGPSWVRRLSSSAQPLIGAYHSSDPEVMRWQLRCAKAAGIDALQIQLYPHIGTGSYYTREKAFARLLEIAAQEKMPVFAHDELMFVPGAAQEPANMRARIAQFLKTYGGKPGYHRIDGKPVFAFQYWNKFLPVDRLQGVLRGVIEDVPGGVHFQISGGIGEELSALEEVGSVVAFGNAHPHLKPYQDRSAEIDWERLDRDIERMIRYRELPERKPVALLGYVGFEASAQGEGTARWLPRGHGLSYLNDVLKRYAAARPDILVLSSWNDWNENTALEPSLNVDSRGDDPYEALRFIAYLKGKEFVPPPLPDLDHIDPWMRAFHGGEDRTPPYAVNAWLAPNIGELRFSFIDETSPVASARIARTSTAGISWSGGSAVSQGLVNDPAAPVTGSHGWSAAPLAHEFKFRFEDPAVWKAGEAVWAVVVYQDLAPGRLVVSYPNALPESKDPTDGWNYPAALPIRTSGSGEWKVRVRRLNGFDPAGQGNWLSLIHYPAKEKWPTLAQAAAEAVPLIGSLQLFRASDFSADGFHIDGKSPGDHTVTFRTSDIAWNPASASAVLVTAADAKGNSALPVPIVPGFLKTPLHQPYPLER